MAASVEVLRRTPEAPPTAAMKRFRGYKPESKRASRPFDIKESEGLKQLMAVWGGGKWLIDTSLIGKVVDRKALVETLVGLSYSSKDIEDFSLMLERFQLEPSFSDTAGFFLTAALNRIEENEFVVHTGHLITPPKHIGYRNEKNIVIAGDAGGNVGDEMKAGSILVQGDVKGRVGFGMAQGSIVVEGRAKDFVGMLMTGGSIIVKGDVGIRAGAKMAGGDISIEGDAGDCCGVEMQSGRICIGGGVRDGLGLLMEGGIITVRGDAGTNIGSAMEGGEIRLEGGYGSISGDFKGGRIFHKGRLIAGE